MSNPCIRVLADPVQIRECKIILSQIDLPLVQINKVLNLAGNLVRLKILFLLQREKEMCPCDLSDILGMTVPAISQHLRKMKDGGLIADKKVGQTIFYSIVDESIAVIQPILKSLKNESLKYAKI